jgi:hypothetical protein
MRALYSALAAALEFAPVLLYTGVEHLIRLHIFQ